MNPWRLQTWMGHKRIGETMLYVHVAEARARELPEASAKRGPAHGADARVLAMLGTRGPHWGHPRGRKRKRSPRGLRPSCAKGDSNPHGVTH